MNAATATKPAKARTLTAAIPLAEEATDALHADDDGFDKRMELTNRRPAFTDAFDQAVADALDHIESYLEAMEHIQSAEGAWEKAHACNAPMYAARYALNARLGHAEVKAEFGKLLTGCKATLGALDPYDAGVPMMLRCVELLEGVLGTADGSRADFVRGIHLFGRLLARAEEHQAAVMAGASTGMAYMRHDTREGQPQLVFASAFMREYINDPRLRAGFDAALTDCMFTINDGSTPATRHYTEATEDYVFGPGDATPPPPPGVEEDGEQDGDRLEVARQASTFIARLVSHFMTSTRPGTYGDLVALHEAASVIMSAIGDSVVTTHDLTEQLEHALEEASVVLEDQLPRYVLGGPRAMVPTKSDSGTRTAYDAVWTMRNDIEVQLCYIKAIAEAISVEADNGDATTLQAHAESIKLLAARAEAQADAYVDRARAECGLPVASAET
jgi:hypothetical protein